MMSGKKDMMSGKNISIEGKKMYGKVKNKVVI
jgi:hypothetical protein